MTKKIKRTTTVDIQHALDRIGPYELSRIETRKEEGKKGKEVAGRIVDTGKKKVTEKYKSKKGKIYTLVEEVGAVQRRGVDLGQTKKGKRVKTKLLGVKKKFKGGLMVKPKAAKRGY